jgi:hypothetical protein
MAAAALLPQPSKREVAAAAGKARACRPRQCSAAVSATMGQAKFLGDVIRQVATGASEEFQVLHGDTAGQERQAREKLRERVGSHVAGRFMAGIRAGEGWLFDNGEAQSRVTVSEPQSQPTLVSRLERKSE